MSPYITSALENIRSIVEEIVVSEKSNICLALIEYRDHPPQVRRNWKERNNVLIDDCDIVGSYICLTCA